VKPIDKAGIEEAWADLQQLPTPWSRKPGYADPQRAETEVIEFGTLDDAGFADTGFADEGPASIEPPAMAPIAQAAPIPPARESNRVEQPERLAAVLPLDMHREADDSLDTLESHLTDLETEYEPFVERQPEVELVLGPTRRDPFTETFVQEEVVVNRYAAADRASPKRTMVYSSEGRSLSLLLEAGRRMREKSEATGATPAAVETAPAASAVRPAVVPPIATAETVGLDRVAPPSAPPSSTVHPAASSANAGRPSILRPVRETSSGLSSDPVEPEDFVIVPKRPQRDADMIIIEDDPHPGRRVDTEASPVRKQDLRQMFARLRRGVNERI